MDEPRNDPEPDDRPQRHMPNDWQPPRHGYGDERDDYDERSGRVGPREKVRPPGLALMIVGWIGVVLSLAGIALCFVFLIEEQNNPGAPDATESLVTFILLIVVGFGSTIASIFVIFGGSRMRQCRNWGLAFTASILTISSIAVLGFITIFVMPVGIWALIVLSDADVKREFERTAGTYRRPSSDDWD